MPSRISAEIAQLARLARDGGLDLSQVSLRVKADLLMSTPSPAPDDLAAFGAMLGLRHRGREAGIDFSIIGCDDVQEAAQWYPALTTIRNFQDEMGRTSAEFLISRIADPDAPPRRHLLTPALVIRGTTTTPRG